MMAIRTERSVRWSIRIVLGLLGFVGELVSVRVLFAGLSRCVASIRSDLGVFMLGGETCDS